MKKPIAKSNGSQSLGLLLARLPLGIVLALAGYTKFHTIGLKPICE